MKRALLILLALPILWFASRALMHAFASDETLIRWQLEAMREGYNEGKMSYVVRPIHEDWRHEGSSVDRDLVKRGLLQEFLQDRHPKTKKLMRRLDFDENALDLRVEGAEAELVLEVWFSRLQGGEEWREVWRARIEADLTKTDDGWRLLRTRHEDLKGSSRSR